MKYKSAGNIEHEVDGPYSFEIVETGQGIFKDKCLKLSNSTVAPDYQSDHYAFAMAIVASCPPFLRKEDCAWILGYLHELRVVHHSLKAGYGRSGVNDLLYEYSQNNDVVSLIRLMFTLDVASDILCGGLIVGHDYFPSDEDRSIYSERYSLSIFGDVSKGLGAGFEDSEVGMALRVYYDKALKRDLTQRVFSGVEVAFVIPPGEELVTDIQGQMEALEAKEIAARIKRFYKTELFWTNRGFIELYPRFIKSPRQRLDSEPLIPVELPPILEYGFYGSVLAYIPLHWISSVNFEGEHRSASSSFVPGALQLRGRF